MSTTWNSTWMAAWTAWALRVAEAFRSPSGPLPPTTPHRAGAPRKVVGGGQPVTTKTAPRHRSGKRHA